MSIKNLTPKKVFQANKLFQQITSIPPNTSQRLTKESNLELLLDSILVFNPGKEIRLKYYSSGIFGVAIKIVQAERDTFRESLTYSAWRILECGVTVPDLDQDNIITLQKGIDHGFLALAVREIKMRRSLLMMDRAFSCIVNSSIHAQFIPNIISSGALQACVEIIRTGGDYEYDPLVRKNISTSFSVLSSIGARNPHALRDLPGGLIEASIPYISLLQRVGNDELVILGFKAARMCIQIFLEK
jgi:hypothetical protein